MADKIHLATVQNLTYTPLCRNAKKIVHTEQIEVKEVKRVLDISIHE